MTRKSKHNLDLFREGRTQERKEPQQTENIQHGSTKSVLGGASLPLNKLWKHPNFIGF